MNEQLLLGAEAIAIGAIDAGISGVYAYPGTPSTEITEYIQKSKEAQARHIRSKWSANEKTAYETALGMSYAGKRTMVCMKHVGLNVAADAFINSAITGINGGMVVVVADDPSMHSSQNEQDTRVYGKFAFLPILEPSNQQETYEAVRYAFDLSETVKLPVLLRITTRLSHSRAVVQRNIIKEQNVLVPDTEKRKWILLPAIARARYAKLLDAQSQLVTLSENSLFNRLIPGTGTSAVIAFGIAYNYVMEVKQSHQLDIPVLKISQYPLPERQIKSFLAQYDEILIAEEGYPVYEELLRGYLDNKKLRGRLDGTLPRMGELSPDVLGTALGIQTAQPKAIPGVVVSRPPELCKGCSHRDLYEALNMAMSGYAHQHVMGDIGCYTLGALKPYETINTCVDMGASITMAKGVADAGLHPAVAVIGDSTFTHSGMTGLLDCVNDQSSVTIIISDNGTTAMTGGQDSAGNSHLFDICKGLGVDKNHIRILVPLKSNQEINVRILKEEIEYPGVSVILACRECVQVAARNKKAGK